MVFHLAIWTEKNIAFAVSEAKLATPYTTNTTTRQDTTPYTTNTTTVFHFKVQNAGTEIFISNEWCFS